MFYDIRGMRLRNDGGNAHANKIKKVSSTWKMEDHGQNMALFYQIWRLPAPHRHLMGEYPVHLLALSGQIRVHITLQGDVGVGVSQQFAEGLYITPRLQTGGSKGVSQRVRTYLPDGRLLQIRLNAFPIAAGFGGFRFTAGQEPRSIAGASAQLFQHNKQLFRDWNFPAGGSGFGCLDDHLCMAVSTGNSADRPVDLQRAKFQVKIAPLQAADLTNSKPQLQPQ